jgi:ferritin-like metal-binding protein YciE
MRSKTPSKSANSNKARGTADKRQNSGSTGRQQGSARNQNSANGRGQERSSGSRSESVSGRGQQGAGGRGSQGSAERSGSGAGNAKKESGASGSGGSPQGESPLEKFFLAQLKDIYYAEQKITQSLPKMQEAATTEELKDAFEDHLRQTQRHIKRLEKVFQTLNKKAAGEKCEAIEGIAREVESIIGETEEGTFTRDAALIIAAQKVEHYEIATYGGLVQLAITMGLHDAADLLDKTLIEEEDTDSLLTEIAENQINLQAEHEGNHYSWDQKQKGETDETEEEDET